DQVEPLLAALAKYNLLDSVNVEKRIGRTYPSLFHAAQILGFTNAEGEGIEGLEYALEKQLNPYPRVGEEQITYGNDVYLTLDMDIQYALDVQLQEIANLYDPNIIMGIIMDAKTGDILALGSYPWYDPNAFSRSNPRQRTNNTISTLLEPGSVFKLFSLASVLKAGEAKLDESFECTGSYSFQAGNSTVTINCSTAHGTVDPQMMIAKSCNGAIAHWARQTDEEAFYQTLVDLGFTRSWDIGLPSRPRAQIADPSTWSARSKATIAFGQELLATSLHLATAATALGIDGDLLQPHLILRIIDASTGTIVKQREKEVVAHLFDRADTALIRKGMHKATSDEGTGYKARVNDFEIGIKTGTAQLFNPEKNSYSDGSTLASSLALAPIEDPAYIIYIGVEGGRGWGADLAAPGIGNLVQALISQGKLRKTR
ncbi:MAG: penicillin-binding protein 2, partial [Sphaerochaeta sp.]